MIYRKTRKNTQDTWAALTLDGAVHFLDYLEGDWWWLPGDGSWAYPYEPMVRHFFRPGATAQVGQPIVLDAFYGSLEPPLVETIVTTPPVSRLLRFPAESGAFFACLEGWNPFHAVKVPA